MFNKVRGLFSRLSHIAPRLTTIAVISPSPPIQLLSSNDHNHNKSKYNNFKHELLSNWLNCYEFGDYLQVLRDECQIDEPKDFMLLNDDETNEIMDVMGIKFAKRKKFLNAIKEFNQPNFFEEEPNSNDNNEEASSFKTPQPTKKIIKRRSYSLKTKYDFCKIVEDNEWTIPGALQSPIWI